MDSDMDFEKLAGMDVDMFLKTGYEYPHMDEYFLGTNIHIWMCIRMRIFASGLGYGYPHRDCDSYF